MPTMTQEKSMTQTVEKLEHFTCRQTVFYDGECGEIAEYRVRLGSLAVTFCAFHADKYVRGAELLKEVKCARCSQLCKPGYIYRRDISRSFCGEDCQREFEEANGISYR